MGTGWNALATAVHGAAGIAVVSLVPWKQAIVRAGLAKRWSASMVGAVALAVLRGGALASGIVHVIGPRRVGDASLLGLDLAFLSVHVALAVLALPLLAWHVVARRGYLTPPDDARRRLLQAGTLGAAAGAATLALQVGSRLAPVGGDRRVTGSHELGTDDPAAMPVVQWFTDAVPSVDASTWRLVVRAGGIDRRLGHGELADFVDANRATLDCTRGWYADQDWEGVRLARLLPHDVRGRSVVVRSVTGYDRRFPLGDANRLLLATRVGGAELSPGHGFPARLVAPGRRGFWWVKWVEEVAVDDTPWWWQPPFPLQ